MLWIGITGPMGSGKSTVSNQLRQMGFVVLDADQIAHKVLGPGTAAEALVFKTFGQAVKDKKGHLDRRALGRMVFGHPEKLAALEKIVHPRVQAEVELERKKLGAAGHRAAFYDVPLLFEKKMQPRFDHVVVVSADQPLRHARLKARSQLSDQEILDRSKHHVSPAVKEKAATVVIKNNGTQVDLNGAILKALKKLKIPLPTAT